MTVLAEGAVRVRSSEERFIRGVMHIMTAAALHLAVDLLRVCGVLEVDAGGVCWPREANRVVVRKVGTQVGSGPEVVQPRTVSRGVPAGWVVEQLAHPDGAVVARHAK